MIPYLPSKVAFEASSFTSVMKSQSIDCLIGYKEGGRFDLRITEPQGFMEIIQIGEEISQTSSQNLQDPK